jgi:hypothetical protein
VLLVVLAVFLPHVLLVSHGSLTASGHASGTGSSGQRSRVGDDLEAGPSDVEGEVPTGGKGSADADAAMGSGEGTLPSEGTETPSLGDVLPAGIWTSQRLRAQDLQEGVALVLRGYRDRGDCALAQAGVLDLTGRIWGCVVQGDQWVDVCVVSEPQDHEGCELAVLHLTAQEAQDMLGEGES